jgi:hypothetical protein
MYLIKDLDGFEVSCPIESADRVKLTIDDGESDSGSPRHHRNDWTPGT